MSDRDRSEFVALVAVVCTVVVFLIGLAAGLGYPASEQKSRESYQQIQQNAEHDVFQANASPDDFNFWRDPFPQYAMAVFAAFATGASFWAIFEVRKTFKETERTAEAAIEANKIARDTANRQLRAYVGTAEISIANLAVGKVFKASIKWTNRGQTPARILRSFAAVRATTDPEREKFYFGATGGASKSAIGAAGFVVHEIGALSVVTDEMFTPIVDGNFNLVIGAYLIYQDVFGVTRRTVVRAMLDRRSIVDGTAGIHYCTRNNKAS